ncbi:MAG: PIN domain-containing protein [bacterium]
MPDKVLVDTSVWVDFFRKSHPERHDCVAALLRDECAVGTGIVALELIRGSRTEKELRLVMELFDIIETIHPTPQVYLEAGKTGFQLAQKGLSMSVVDLLIAQIAMENDLPLFSLDRHFEMIAAHSRLRLFRP